MTWGLSLGQDRHGHDLGTVPGTWPDRAAHVCPFAGQPTMRCSATPRIGSDTVRP